MESRSRRPSHSLNLSHVTRLAHIHTQVDAVGNDMDVGVLACNRHLVVVKSHLLGEEIRDLHQIERGQSFLILRCNAYFNAEKLVPASAVIINLHLLVNFLWCHSAEIVENKASTQDSSLTLIRLKSTYKTLPIQAINLYKTRYFNIFAQILNIYRNENLNLRSRCCGQYIRLAAP